MSFSSNAVTAKARAVYGRSLTERDFAALAAKSSVADVCAYLKQTDRCGQCLSAANPQTIHRGQLEALLRRNMFNIFESFHRFDHSGGRSFFPLIIMRSEAEQILTAIECAAYGSAEAYISSLPAFLDEHTKTDLYALGSAQGFGDIARILAPTPYGAVLADVLAKAQADGRIEINECERRLYAFYAHTCMKQIQKNFRGSERTDLKRAVLKCMDMENVVTVARMSRFSADPADINAQLIPMRYMLTPEAVERLAQSPDPERIRAELESMGYRAEAGAPTVELLTEEISLKFLRHTLRLSQSSALVYFALAELLSIENKNIKTVIEGIRYGMPSGDIMSLLVL